MATLAINNTTIEVYESEIRFEFGEKSFGAHHTPKRMPLDVTVLYSVEIDADEDGRAEATPIVRGFMVKESEKWRHVSEDEFLFHMLEMAYEPDNQELLDLVPHEDLYAA